ncbi:MAG: type I DNA topoisomerase [Kiritimatiellae bacterium]|nr:type I DNA topoisomerase [Kiritimatiellia bacterium]
MGKKKLLIVESPAKAKTIGKYLGGEFVVKSSVGHVRDLPKVSGAIRITPVAEGEWKFQPTYIVSEGKEKVVSELKAAAKSADEIYLASDPDREGEAIAWHLKEILSPTAKGKPFHRVSYNEITKTAVLKAISAPGEINMPRVDAQQARRILDRLVGYKVSPLLWSNINCANSRTLSAGRVQSVALRLLVERQREIDAFQSEVYFVMGVEAAKKTSSEKFFAKLAKFDGEKPEIKDKQTANNVLLDLAGAELRVKDLKEQPKKRNPLAPFTTSTLQQAASSVLGFSPGKTMKIAQSLYERGIITYMRTDSVNVSAQARAAAKDYIISNFGGDFYPAKPNIYKSKGDAQEAHEAIRPTNIGLMPADSDLTAADLKLYDLIWRRFIASQMSEARTTVKTAYLEAVKQGLTHSYLFTASCTVIDFEGFLKVMNLSLKRKKDDDEEDGDSDEVATIPPLNKGELLNAARWLAEEKQTKGPPHYSEASLIKALEENGVGRPSTYAQTIETLKAREYAVSEKRKLIPLERGILVCDWLVKKLESLFNVGYTAKMEAELDKIEDGQEPMNKMLSGFYSRFTKAIAEANPAPDSEKFKFVFSLLDEVKEWKKSKKIGNRIYDDKAFVESVKKQMQANTRPLTTKQLEFLIRMAIAYSAQIPDVEQRLKEAGLGAGATIQPERADEELVKFCFEMQEKIGGGLMQHQFLKSLREQWERGKLLSIKQFAILAKAIGENCSALENCREIREKLRDYAPPGGFGPADYDPTIPKILAMLRMVKEWRPHMRKAKKVYDDKSFVDSLADQYTRRRTLSTRQLLALKRVAVSYKDQIPNYEKLAPELGLLNIPSSFDKEAQVLEGVDDQES